MAKEWAKRFYNSARWQKCRHTYITARIAADGGMCEECGRNVGYIIHHRTPLTPENINNPDVSLNADNLEYVCKQCHDMFEGHGRGGHGIGQGSRPLCRFTADGQPIPAGRADGADSPLSG